GMILGCDFICSLQSLGLSQRRTEVVRALARLRLTLINDFVNGFLIFSDCKKFFCNKISEF
ncbi:hypothetical protein, partial [Bartonella sp. CB15SXKL]|uniref:hypothetical protein n=1 Tax=Bartonella sp. CB15SXKL TaxID=3243512 RepID=UPI0035D0CD64